MCSQEPSRSHDFITKATKRTKTTKAKPLIFLFSLSFVSFVFFVPFVIERGIWAQAEVSRQQVLDAMKRATTFMVEKASTKGGYVWSYLPDFSRRWGEMEARPSMVWIQPPGTPTMGHLFLDAYHATGDEYYYRAAEKVADVLALGQHASGGWNYMVDLAGEESLRDWYNTIGRNGWRLEEFQHYWGNATFDDAGTAESAKFLLRMYLEKRDALFKGPLDRAIQFILQSQYPNGAWPQRYPLTHGMLRPGNPDYTSYYTFNDDVAAENIDFLAMCYRALGESKLLDPIARAMDAFVVMQQPKPQAGWALQYTPDLKPAAARTYEPRALVTHTTATNVELLIKFYKMTGQPKFLARIPDALEWLDTLKLPPGVAPGEATHPTFVEPATNNPLYVHREGSNVVNGRYYVDGNPKKTIVHYSSFRRIDLARLRKMYADAKALDPELLAKASPLARDARPSALPRLFVSEGGPPADPKDIITSLNSEGYWLVPLRTNSHPYRGDGPSKPMPGDFSQTHVGDASDTSPYPDEDIKGISTSSYIRNMSVLIRWLEDRAPKKAGGTK